VFSHTGQLQFEAVPGGSDAAHLISAGAGPLPMDCNGVPWCGSYITSSGNPRQLGRRPHRGCADAW
jgi:Mn-containing catalase